MALVTVLDGRAPVRAATGRYVVSSVTTMLLGTLGGLESEAFDINNVGYVVGAAQRADGTRHAFRVSAAGMVDLGTLGRESAAHTINERGVAAGYVLMRGSNARQPALFDAGGARVVPNLTRPFGSCTWSTEVWGLNDLGAMSGIARPTGPPPTDCAYKSSAVHWSSARATPVEHTVTVWREDFAGQGFRINGSGLAAGRLGLREAFLFRGADTLTLLPPAAPPPATCETGAYGINDAANVVGYARCGSTTNPQPAIWYTSGGRPNLLPLPAGYAGGEAMDINAQRFVVGTASPPAGAPSAGYYAPFLWGENLGTVQLMPPAFGSTCQANALTNLAGGRISVVGHCRFAYGKHAVQWNVFLRWIPVAG